MSKRLMLTLAILGIFGASGAVLAAQRPSGDFDQRHVHHMKHQPQAQQYQGGSWNLPEGWPHS